MGAVVSSVRFFQYSRTGSQKAPSPSSKAFPFCVMMAETRSGCAFASLGQARVSLRLRG